MTSSLSGRRIGNFEVGPLVGAGGMGEVYRGRDTKLDRDVAIKVLLPSVAGDAERLARFSREAQVLASLNHPNIAHIHGVEQGPDGPLLVLEFVDGPTLADRIAGGPLPVDESMAIARQITDALEAAHERGVIHRDLKPANIKVDDNGTVKVLDFGLAKAIEPGAGSREPGAEANSPTITTPAMTQAGLILGTAAYMSPEQAKGRVVDKRTDVWAFGCVLFEMLAGKRAFEGEDVTDTIAAVVRGEPDWRALPQDTPEQVVLLLRRCLDKDRRTRISDISVARFLLNERIDSGAAPVPAAVASSTSARRYAVALAALVIGAGIVGGAAWILWPADPEARTARFTYTPPLSQPLMMQGNDRDVAIARDGSFFVYRSASSNTAAHLVIRSLNELDGRPLAGSDGARSPEVSPDGRWVAFTAAGELRKVPAAGGPPTTICKIAGAIRGLSWGDDDTIVFGVTQAGGLQRVQAAGGEPQQITKPEPGVNHVHPFVMPGSKAVLYTASTANLNAAIVRVVDLNTGTEKTLLNGAHNAAYLGGFLVYTTNAVFFGNEETRYQATLRATRFDVARLEVHGDAVAMVDGVSVAGSGSANFATSARGDVIYMPAGAMQSQDVRRTLVWVDRSGRETPIDAPMRTYATVRISPDGTKVALDVRDQTNDVWIWDLARQTLTPLNRAAAQDMAPIWMPDGRRLVWTSTRTNTVPNLYWQFSDGTGTVDRLSTAPNSQFPTSVTPDGRYLILFGSSPSDIFRMDLRDPAHKVEPLIAGPAMELGAELSPDGRWLAYHSNESGEPQVFVRPFPNVQEGRFQISTDGGSRPSWSRRGDELFYLNGRGLLSSVAITVGAKGLTAGTPRELVKTPYYIGRSIFGLDLRAYDVAPDGKRFLMIKDADEAAAPAQSARLIVALNWIEELRARLPAQ